MSGATSSGPKPVKEQRPHPEHGPVVVDVFNRIGRNEAINAIVTDLNARGVVAPAGERWHRNTIRKMVLNVAYIGKRSRLGQVHEGVWEGLVSQEVRSPGRGRQSARSCRRRTSYVSCRRISAAPALET